MMLPQDIIILLKKMTTQGKAMSCRGLADSLGMSASNVSKSLERCKKAQLIDRHKKKGECFGFARVLDSWHCVCVSC